MPKLTKRTVDVLQSKPDREIFAWDNELRGFGVRIRPSGARSYIIQYRNSEGRSRRLTLGSLHVLTPEQARGLARDKLGSVCKGEDRPRNARRSAGHRPCHRYATGTLSRPTQAACLGANGDPSHPQRSPSTAAAS